MKSIEINSYTSYQRRAVIMKKYRTITTTTASYKGLKYFFYQNEWQIHNGKQILYQVKDQELIKQLEAVKKTKETQILEIFYS